MTLFRRTTGLLASLELTLALMAAVLAVLCWSRVTDREVGRILVVPFALLFVNLAAAVAHHQTLRRQVGLLVFHLGLAMLALVAAVGRLLALDGHVEVAEGTPFDVANVVSEAAPFHPFGLAGASFVQGPFTIDYEPGMHRRHTRSTVYVAEGGTGWRQAVVGDDHPLLIGGYRLYTTANKGFAPILTWIDADGREQTGAFHLPSYPANDDRQGNEWALPDGSGSVVLWLEMPTPVLDEHAAWSFHVPADARLAVVNGERRDVLVPGQSIALGQGRLRYERLSSWMGYAIFYDPTLPWLLAAALVAFCGLGWHALRNVRAMVKWPVLREVNHAD
jgi:cytochrome c biogenesis protein ResB